MELGLWEGETQRHWCEYTGKHKVLMQTRFLLWMCDISSSEGNVRDHHPSQLLPFQHLFIILKMLSVSWGYDSVIVFA